MNTKDINVLLKKADELRSLFVLGQRVIPFLEEIFVFVKEIQPMLDEINKSINENMKKMPGASEKLSKVTEANELATTEIMNTLDKMFEKTDKMSDNQSQISENYEKLITKPVQLLEIIRSAIASKTDLTEALPQIDSAINKIKAFDNQKIKPLEQSNNNMIDDINNDASAIMMSLQVQDITSQQIAAVDHMLKAIQGRLNTILEHFKNTDISSLADGAHDDDDPMITKSANLHREIAFDPNAIKSIQEKETRQNDVDDWIDSARKGELVADEPEVEEDSSEQGQDDIDAIFSSSNEFSEDESAVQGQDDIDAMFNSVTEEASDEPQGQDDIDAMFSSVTEEESNEPQGQDDIDAMFNSVAEEASDEPQGQDDIDAMFNATMNDSEESDTSSEENFDLSKFDELGENPDPSDIDALFSQGE